MYKVERVCEKGNTYETLSRMDKNGEWNSAGRGWFCFDGVGIELFKKSFCDETVVISLEYGKYKEDVNRPANLDGMSNADFEEEIRGRLSLIPPFLSRCQAIDAEKKCAFLVG